MSAFHQSPFLFAFNISTTKLLKITSPVDWEKPLTFSPFLEQAICFDMLPLCNQFYSTKKFLENFITANHFKMTSGQLTYVPWFPWLQSQALRPSVLSAASVFILWETKTDAQSSHPLGHSSNVCNGTRSQAFSPCLPCGWQAPSHLSPYLLPLKVCHSRKPELEAGLGFNPRHTRMGCRSPQRHPDHSVRCLLQAQV